MVKLRNVADLSYALEPRWNKNAYRCYISRPLDMKWGRERNGKLEDGLTFALYRGQRACYNSSLSHPRILSEAFDAKLMLSKVMMSWDLLAEDSICLRLKSRHSSELTTSTNSGLSVFSLGIPSNQEPITITNITKSFSKSWLRLECQYITQRRESHRTIGS